MPGVRQSFEASETGGGYMDGTEFEDKAQEGRGRRGSCTGIEKVVATNFRFPDCTDHLYRFFEGLRMEYFRYALETAIDIGDRVDFVLGRCHMSQNIFPVDVR